MSEKNYVCLIIFSVASFLLIVYVLTWTLPEDVYMDRGYPYWSEQKEHVMVKDNRQEVLLLGDSRIKAAVFADELGKNVYNLAVPAGSPIEMYHTLDNYMKYHPKPKAVFVAHAPWLLYEFREEQLKQAMQCGYFDIKEMRDILGLVKENDGNNYTYLAYAYRYRLPNKYMKQVVESLVHSQQAENMRIYQKARQHKGRMIYEPADRATKAVYPPELKYNVFKCAAYMNLYIEKTIELCLENDIPIYLEQMPMGNPGYDMLSERGYISDYQEYMRKLHDKYQIPVNYNIPVYPTEYFFDESHLNEKGAHKFTAEFREKYKFIFDEE
jgi:hypothetical protein